MHYSDFLINFREPQDPLIINGFKVRFRQASLGPVGTLWIPTGICRNNRQNGWKLYLSHSEGRSSGSELDRGKSPLESLQLAWERLLEEILSRTSKYAVDRALQRTGRERLPVTDTGVTGVTLSRHTKYSANGLKASKAIAIQVRQNVPGADGSGGEVSHNTWSVSERRYRSKRSEVSAAFEQALHRGVSVRRYYNELVASTGELPGRPLRYADVPDRIRSQFYDAKRIDLDALFKSFTAEPREFNPKTTFGDPEALAAELQLETLKDPIPTLHLNGFYLKFRKTDVDGHARYLPTGVFRSRTAWRLFVRHEHGVWHDRLEDASGETPLDGLCEAWPYFLSQLRILEAPKRKVPPVTLQLAYTGVEGLTFVFTRLKSGWAVNLNCRQVNTIGKGVQRSIERWNDWELTDLSVRQALIRGTAISRYREALIAENPRNANIPITDASSIPSQYWPAEPVIPLQADDLWYLLENRSD